MKTIPDISTLAPGFREALGTKGPGARPVTDAFADTLKQAVQDVEELQHSSAAGQQAYAEGQPVELHDVLIRVEEAEIAFKMMMEVRNKLVSSYHEIMRMGGGG